MLVGALVGEPQLQHPLEQRQRLLGALVGDVVDLVGAGVHLQGDGRGSGRLLVEPAVGEQLHADVVADRVGQLRVADRVALTGGEHEVGVADDLGLDPGEGHRGAEDALVDDAVAGGELLGGVLGLALARQLGDVDRVGEAGEVAALVLEALLEEQLAEGARRLLLVAVAPQPLAQIAAARLQQVVEAAGGEAGQLLRLPAPLRARLLGRGGCRIGGAHRWPAGGARHSTAPSSAGPAVVCPTGARDHQ